MLKPPAILLAVALTPAFAQTSPPSSLPDLESAGPLGADLYVRSGSTGMVLVLVRDNQVFFRGYGKTAPNSHQLPTQDSFLRLCSLTKIFTSDLLTKLTMDGTVRLDDPLQRFAPAHIVVPKRIKPITLEDLATHTSGLPRELSNAPPGTPHFTLPNYATRWRWLPNHISAARRAQRPSTPTSASTSSAMRFSPRPTSPTPRC